MNTRSIGEVAAAREADWLKRHGAHEYEQHNLVEKIREELADAWNYVNNLPCPGVEQIGNQKFLLSLLWATWKELEDYERNGEP